MSDKENLSDADRAALTGAYALNALTPEQREAFERDLAAFPLIAEEVSGLSETASLMAFAVDPVEPPSALKASIMAQLSSTPQLPAVASGVEDDEHEIAGDPATTEFPDVAEPFFAEAPPAALSTPAGRTAQVRWFTRPLAAAAGIAAVLGLVIGGLATSALLDQPQPSDLAQQADQLAAINAAADRRQAVAEVAGGGTATLVWSNELSSSALIVDGLGQLTDEQVYELWYINEDGPRPAGIFSADASGTTWRVLDGALQPGDVIGVTVEPAGGSPQPTTDPIVAFESA